MDTRDVVFEEIIRKFVGEEIMTKSQFQEWYHKEKKDDRRFMATMIISSAIGLAGVMVVLFQMMHH